MLKLKNFLRAWNKQPPKPVTKTDKPMDDQDLSKLSPQQLAEVAALVGTAAGQLKEIDRNVISGSANMKAMKIDPKSVVREAMVHAGIPQHAPQSQHPHISPPVHPSSTSPNFIPPATSASVVQPTAPAAAVSVAFIDQATLQFLKDEIAQLKAQQQFLVETLERVVAANTQLSQTIANCLQGNIKSITINVNDSPNQE